MKGIILDDNYDIKVSNKSMVLGETEIQDIDILLGMNPGEFKEDPRLGPGLLKFLRGPENTVKVEAIIRRQLAIDRKELDKIKKIIEWRFKT